MKCSIFYFKNMHFRFTLQFYMNKFLILAILSIALATAQTCSEGQIQISGVCTTVNYIQGCVQYISSDQCALCEYGTHKDNSGYRISGKRCQYSQKPVTQCCVLLNQKGSCIQCAPGLYLDGNSCSKIQRPGCLEGKDSLCTNCAKGYTNMNGRCFKQISDCVSYSDKGICSKCQNGYELLKGYCSKIIKIQSIANCRQSNQYGCVTCDDGFYLTKQRNCKLNQVGCLKYFREICQVCSSEFKLINGRCTMEGCTSYSSFGCQKCAQPYALADGKCVLDNCLESFQGQCLVCSGDYRVKSGRCVRAQPDKCNGCANGFFVGENGRCIKSVTGCVSYSEGKCSKCQDPFVLNGGICIIQGCDKFTSQGCQVCFSPFQLVGNKCLISNCQQHNFQNRKCKSCKFGYHIQRGVCVLNNPLCISYSFKDENQVCVKCEGDDYILTQSGSCDKRKPGCFYQNGKCLSCISPFRRSGEASCAIEGCQIYNYDGCTKCKSPYVEKLGACLLANCDEVKDGRCSRCSTGYHLISTGACLEDDEKCASYLGQNCDKCVDGYRLNSQGYCVRKIPFCKVLSYQKCTECQGGYQLNNGNCLISDKNCQKYDEKLQGCVKCIKGFHSESGSCKLDNPSCLMYEILGYTQRCTKCADGFVFNAEGSKCLKQAPGCIYNDKGVCSSCKSPFNFNGADCSIYACSKYSQAGCFECQYPSVRDGDKCVIAFCEVYDSGSTRCSTCKAGYKLIQGKCYREDPKCIEYSQTGVCVKCINEYALFEGVCVKQDQYCLKYSKEGGCNKCKDKYYLSPDSICLPEEPGCVYQKGKCVYCNYPFKFHDGAQKCRIDGCLQAVAGGCSKCRFPYNINKQNVCQIANCVTSQDNHCVRCSPGYHLKQGLFCAKDQPSCLKYNEDGDCQLCDRGWMLMSSGECQIAEQNCIEKNKDNQCTACKSEYFVNKFFQCQVKDKNCEQYNNGVCVNCLKKFFLYQYICFPYSAGCVSYNGKNCVRCKSSYTLKNGQCFKLNGLNLKLEGQDEKYDFDITPIDITKSKYYIDNLSPISKLGKVFYSSFFNGDYTDPRITSEEESIFTKGWKADNARDGQYIGYTISEGEPVTFYAIQLEGVQGNYIKQFYIEYSVDDDSNFIRIEKAFNSEASQKNITTIYFTGIYARSIRIIIKSFYGWPATKIEFFYYDTIRFRKISNLKSLKYLSESIRSNFVDRMDNQMYINQRIFFNPAKSCENKSVCFTGLELCQQRTINSVKISTTDGVLKKVYLTYSIDGANFNCFEKCRQFVLNDKLPENELILNGLSAKNLRIYPAEWTGSPNIKVVYDYS